MPWFPFAISAQTLAYLVDGLILLSAVLLFAVICMAMIGAAPAWPITLILGMGASAVFAMLYRFLFRFWIGGTPGAHLAGLTNDALTGMNREADEQTKISVEAVISCRCSVVSLRRRAWDLRKRADD